MPKQKAKDVKEEVKKLDNENCGEEAVGGSSMDLEADDDVEEMVKTVRGKNSKEKLQKV